MHAVASTLAAGAHQRKTKVCLSQKSDDFDNFCYNWRVIFRSNGAPASVQHFSFNMALLRLLASLAPALTLLYCHGVVMADTDQFYLDPLFTFPPVEPTSSPSPPPTLAPTTSQEPSAAPEPTAPTPSSTKVTFYVIGDVPYSDVEARLLPFELKKMDASAKFLIHLGDIRDGSLGVTGEVTDCPESLFQDLSSIFESSDVTTFFIPGDNGWLDCKNATESYTYWEKYLFKTDLAWPAFPTTVNRWTTFPAGVNRNTRRSEFFSFLLDNVLFVGLSLPGSGRNEDNEWTPRDTLLRDNIQWTHENFDEYAGVMEAVILFDHYYGSLNGDYFDALANIIVDPSYNEPPVLFMEDNHWMNVDEEFLGVPNLLRIEQDDTVTPMKITVDPFATGLGNVFQYDQGCLCSTGHRPTRLITYIDSHRCGGECIEGFTACQDEIRCSPEGAVCDGP